MKAGFYIGRMNYLGHFGVLIDCFQRKSADITLLCDHRKKPKDCGYKAYLYPDHKNIQSAFDKTNVKTFHTTKEFADIIRKEQMQVVFFIAFDEIAKETKVLMNEKKDKVIFAHLQPGMDIVHGRDLSSADAVYLFCENWKIFWKKWLLHFRTISEKEQEPVFEQIDTKTVISGFPQADQLADFDRRLILDKYGIPEGKKVIVYLPFPWRVPFCIWSHIIYKPQNRIIKLARLFLHRAWQHLPEVFNSADDLQVAAAIRQFADRNNAFFLVKGRMKNKIPSYLRRIADKVVFDESYHPYTIMELMFVADLCVHFYSDAIKESAISNTPCICLGPARSQDWTCYAERFFLKDFSPEPGGYYNFDGVVYNESADDFAVNFPQKTFDDYNLNRESRDRFVEKFLGYSDFKSSERIYNHISSLLVSV